MELELWQLARLARRWWWLLVLGPLIGAVVAFVVSGREQSEYTAFTLLRISPSQVAGPFDVDDSHDLTTLAATYRLLIWTTPVLAPVIDELGVNENVEEFGQRISAWQVQDTQLLRISARDSDPTVAASIVNAVAGSLVRHLSAEMTTIETAARQTIDEQFVETSRQVENITQQIQILSESAAATNPSVEAEVGTLQAEADQLQQVRMELLMTAQAMDLNAALAKEQVTIATEAEAPSLTTATNSTLVTVFGALAGVLVAGGAVTILGYLDRTVRTETDFSRLTGSPQLSAIPNVPQLRDPKDRLVMLNQPKSDAAEAIRFLRINIGFATAEGKVTTLAICSPGPGEGKSTIAANLAIALAQSGRPTVLVDADMRNPIQHTIFGVPNESGLSDILSGTSEAWDSLVLQTAVAGLRLVPSGPVPSNPGDLLSRDRLPHLLEQLVDTAEVVVVDTPAMQSASDALVVTANVDGVVLIAQAGKTRIDAVESAATTLRPARVQIVGVVLNGVSALPESGGRNTTERVMVPEKVPAFFNNIGTEFKRRRPT